jgi:arsenite methyltransferase
VLTIQLRISIVDVKAAVKQRYSQGAKARQESLCCPVEYQPELLELLPQEIIEKDYGCGDPSSYVRQGDWVLDLGSGGGKICYMAAQLVGPQGRLIGVDMNDDMLALSRKYLAEMRAKIDGVDIEFRKAHIEDLATDTELLEAHLAANPVANAADYARLEHWLADQRQSAPLIINESIDLVLSNCVLNLVDDKQKEQLLAEIVRVLKPGGRIAISDIVSDQPVPNHLKHDPDLWSGCMAGAFREREFLKAFASAGLVGLRYDKWANQPWQVIEGIEFRAVTVTGCKPVAVAENGEYQIMYRGPYREVEDSNGIRYPRGERVTLSAQRYHQLQQSGFGDDFVVIVAPASDRSGQQNASCCAPRKGPQSDSCCG